MFDSSNQKSFSPTQSNTNFAAGISRTTYRILEPIPVPLGVWEKPGFHCACWANFVQLGPELEVEARMLKRMSFVLIHAKEGEKEKNYQIQG